MYLFAKQRKEITGLYKGFVKTIRLNCFKYELVFNHPKKIC